MSTSTTTSSRRTALALCCGAIALTMAACASGSSGNAATSSSKTGLTSPNVGRPAAPDSAQAALAAEPLNAYTNLGSITTDPLAPNESQFSVHAACLAAAGFPGSDSAFDRSDAGLATMGTGPSGPWGYLGTGESAMVTGFPAPSDPAPSVPASPAESTARTKCRNVAHQVENDVQGPLNDIRAVAKQLGDTPYKDPSIVAATKDWSDCMTKSGYNYPGPDELMATVKPTENALSANEQTIRKAKAAADATCTQSSDLAGIYFAVQAAYQKEVVDANQPRLTTDAQNYRAGIEKDMGQLSTLLSKAPATAWSPGDW